ncbi:MAG TPA: RNA 2',3'-cyclic phosphodiesterase, partial [Planctomycetaceae bacterium]|nr:RNA 2',3'-cyclic phosphodiesterase [Planctomycetaceae bacterium]
MPRYFVAIPLPEDVRDELVRAQPVAAEGLRIVCRNELHVTLHFLGEVAAANTEALHSALASVRVAPFRVAVSGSGRFSQSAVFFYARVEASPALIELHRAVGAALREAIGFQVEDRPYQPHVTLARAESTFPETEIERLASPLAHIHIDSMVVDRFALYTSEFINGVPMYREQAIYQ